MKRVLVVSPHPDDEAIGCGGTILKHVEMGDVVEVVFLTSGENGGHGRSQEETRILRQAEAQRACEILGLAKIEFWGLTDGGLRATIPTVERMRSKINMLNPDRIYVTHDREMHPDHRASARIVRRALAGAAPGGRVRPEVLMYEVWTPLQRMDEIIEITPYLDRKLEAIRAYATQCDVVGFDAAVTGLNRYRGEMHCWPEGRFAEVFAALER